MRIKLSKLSRSFLLTSISVSGLTLLLFGISCNLIGSVLPVSAQAKGPDMGYPNLPRFEVDVNADGKLDFCRFVGNAGRIFLSCQLATKDGYSTNQFGINSRPGIDIGYDDLPRTMKDVNQDGRADFCRFIGNQGDPKNPIRESCLLATPSGFSSREFSAD